MKSQEIIAMTLVLLISLVAVSITYVWAKPMIDKSSDKVTVDRCISYSRLIQNSINDVVKTGGSENIRINIPNSVIYFSDNQIIIKCKSHIQVLPNFFVPISYDHSPIEKKNIKGETNDSCGTNCKNGTIILNEKSFEFKIINTSSEYDKVCIDTCGFQGDYITAGNFSYQIAYIDENGNYTYLLGNYIQRHGIFGVDPLSVIVGKQSGNVELRIVFWDELDKFGRFHRIHIKSDRLSTNGIINLYIVKGKSNSTDTYININVI